MSDEPPKHLTASFEQAGSPMISATGAFGGSSPDGNSVVATLYAETWALPNYINYKVKDGGDVDLTQEERVSRSDIARLVQATLVLSPEAAVSIGEFLIQHGNNAIANRKKRQ